MVPTEHRTPPRRTRRAVGPAIASALVALLVACAQPASPAKTTVAVVIDPTAASLAPGQGQAFSATVTGSADTSVIWSTTCGTIVGSGATIAYQAPEATGTCLVTATSVVDPERSATATVTVDVIGIALDPPSTEAFTLQTRRFTATVVGTSDTAVDWDLTPGCGILTPDGTQATYAAPDALPTSACTLTAISVTAPDQRATAAITVFLRPQGTLTVDPAEAHPNEDVALAWDLANPTGTLELTCELDAAGDGAAIATIPDCGRHGSPSHQVHAFAERGTFRPALTVLQGDDVLARVTAEVEVAIRFVQISGGEFHSAALDRSGDVWGWGGGGYVGDGTFDRRSVPVPVCAAGSGPTCTQLNLGTNGRLIAGRDHVLARDGLGGVWAWGYNGDGRLGDGTTEPFRTSPVRVCVSGSGSTCDPLDLGPDGSVSAAFDHSVAVASDGRVWAWGANSTGQLGDGTTVELRSNPVPVCATGSETDCEQLNLGPRGQVSAAARRTLAVDSDGRVWAWGGNLGGGLGDGTTVNQPNPVAVCAAGSGADCEQLSLGTGGSLSAGGDVFTDAIHAVAVDGDGRVWAWGSNDRGQLGDGTTTDRPTPVPVCARGTGRSCTQLNLGRDGSVSAGKLHVVAVDGLGRAWSWGENSLGQLGDGSTGEDRALPAAVCATGSGATCAQLELGAHARVGTGLDHSFAIDAGGNAWGWGRNTSAQLGDGTTESIRRNPVRVAQP